MLNIKGILCFINPIAFLVQSDCVSIRKLILTRRIKELLDLSYINVFKEADTYTVIFSIQNDENIENFKYQRYFKIKEINELKKLIFPINSIIDDEFKIVLSENINLLFKLNAQKNNIGNIANIICGTSSEGFGKQITTEKTKFTEPILQSSDIKRYKIDWLKQYIPKKLFPIKKVNIFNKNKIVMARMTDCIRCAFDENKYYCGKINAIVTKDENVDTLKILMAILNSKLINFFYKETYRSLHKKGDALGFDIPSIEKIPLPPKINNNKIVNIVNTILNITKQNNYLGNINSQNKVKEYEEQIDIIIYKLYKLTYEEILIIDKNFKLSKEEYNNFIC